MDPQLWSQVRAAFSEALAQPADARSAFVETLPGEVALEVRAMLQAHECAGDFLQPAAPFPAVGARLGRYILTELVARGGMGEVYRARREDSPDHQVAVKILSPIFLLPEAERLFARERQILAHLSHPNIVTLIDDGVSGGRHYLVMEWVDGQPLHRWARSASLDERLQLFVMVCGAVHSAHQQLVLHCDIKPSNILVTQSGQPKLLDFGIARLLSKGSDLTGASVGHHVLTLSYASPEQARHLPAGIPSDIFSLGLILYELVALQPAQDVQHLPLDEAIHRITAGYPPPVPGMARDLEAIIGKATAKEPASRYASALELAGDVERFRSGYPVQARPADFRYTLSRFVRRNLAAVAVGLAGLIALVASLAAFMVQFQAARHHREIAERRFQASREMARWLVFDAPQRLVSVPGTIDTRRWMAQQATRYLEQLSKDVLGSPDLALDIAKGYRQVAMQHYNVEYPNLNDPAAALRNLEQGALVLEAISNPSPAIVEELILNRLARPYLILRRKQEALDNEHAADVLVQRLVAQGDPSYRLLQAKVWHKQASNTERSFAEQLSLWGKLEAFYRERLAGSPSSLECLRDLALVHKNISGVYTALHNWEEALRHDRQALVLDEKRFAISPENPNVRMDLSFSLGRIGQDLVLSGRRPDGIRYLRRAVAIRRELLSLDPADRRAADRLAWMLGELGHALLDSPQTDEGVRLIREALKIRSGHQVNGYGQNSTPHLHYLLAVSAEKRGLEAEACREWTLAARFLPVQSASSREFDRVLPVEELRRRAAACNPR